MVEESNEGVTVEYTEGLICGLGLGLKIDGLLVGINDGNTGDG